MVARDGIEPPPPAFSGLRSTTTPIYQAAKDTRFKARNPITSFVIQIHLPASKDVEVFNAIFKSLRDHPLTNHRKDLRDYLFRGLMFEAGLFRPA